MSPEPTLAQCLRSRYNPADRNGFYESYFVRANHPTRPLAFWIRYTLLVPRGAPEKAAGELWAIFFDGERPQITAVRQAQPLHRCSFAPDGSGVRIGEAALGVTSLQGQASCGADTLGWALRCAGDAPPLLLLPRHMYEGPFPKAKSLVATPFAAFAGSLRVNEREIDVTDWIGSRNHNWGSRHTERYAWGQVAGFDDEPSAFLECATARVYIGPIPLPLVTTVVLRLRGEELALRGLGRALRARAAVGRGHWRFDSRRPGLRIEGELRAPMSSFVALRYGNPPGGYKTCLNTKLAAARLTVHRDGQPPLVLRTAHRAAFELLGDEPPPPSVAQLTC